MVRLGPDHPIEMRRIRGFLLNCIRPLMAVRASASYCSQHALLRGSPWHAAVPWVLGNGSKGCGKEQCSVAAFRVAVVEVGVAVVAVVAEAGV